MCMNGSISTLGTGSRHSNFEQATSQLEREYWEKMKEIVYEANQNFLRNINDSFPYVEGFMEESSELQKYFFHQFEAGKSKEVLMERLEKEYAHYRRNGLMSNI